MKINISILTNILASLQKVDLENLEQRRDTQMLRPGGHIVLHFEADNPGIWPFHCHVAWHVSGGGGGLYINLLEQPESISRLQIPNIIKTSCRAWELYSKK